MNINSDRKKPLDDNLDRKKVERQKEKNIRKKKLSQALRTNLQRRKAIIES